MIISKITAVKYCDDIRPTLRPFCATISATSPLVIIPTPILRQSIPLNPHNLDIIPHPIILETSAIITNAIENTISAESTPSIFVFNPILAKNTGPKSI